MAPICTPKEYECTWWQARCAEVGAVTAKRSVKEIRPLVSLEEYTAQIRIALSLRSPLDQAEEVDLSFLNYEEAAEEVRDQIRFCLEDRRQVEKRWFDEDEVIAREAIGRGMGIRDNFGVIVIGEGADTFEILDTELQTDLELRDCFTHGELLRRRWSNINSEFDVRVFESIIDPNRSSGPQSAEIQLQKVDSHPENFAVMGLHGSGMGVANVILHIDRLVRKLGLAVHFDTFIKPTPDWPGVFHRP